MSGHIAVGGQHPGAGSGGGKRRSPTSNPHRGSRVEPSHLTSKARGTRHEHADENRPHAPGAGPPGPPDGPPRD